MKILVVTSVFPNSKQPALGVFVRERMFKVAQQCELKVVAPVPWFPLVRFIKKDYRPLVPYLEIQDGIEIYHPRFFNIPKYLKFLDGFFFFLSAFRTLRKIRKDFDFDLIDAHFVYPDGLGAVLLAQAFRCPVTITIRGTLRKFLGMPTIKWQLIYALTRANRVFAVCADLKNAALELGIPNEKVVVVPNGIDIEKFKRIDQVEARKEVGLPHDKKIIISVGGLVERKGFHRVLEVLPEIKKEIPDILYVIVGGASVEGNYEPVLRQLVKSRALQENVLFAGVQAHDQLYRWLSAADVFCLATSNEGWANVFLEAMACGLPVVTSRVGGNEEVVASEAVGMLFDLQNRDALRDALLESFRKNWDREGIVDYAKNNTWDKRVTQLSKEFAKVMLGSFSFISESAES